MNLITVWLAQDCWDDHLLFYNLSQNINRLKDILQIFWTLLGPLFKWPAPSDWYQKKGLVILHISCSTTVQKCLAVLEISVQVSFRGQTCNSLKEPHRNKMKGAYFSELDSDQLLFYNICKIFVVLEILEIKDSLFWPLKETV